MKTIPIKLLLLILLSLGIMNTAAIAGIGKGHHVNIVSFQKDDEVQGIAKYPATFIGNFSALIASMEGKADVLMMVHTPHIHSGDVINVQVDVLGDSGNGMENDGLNCSLSYNAKDTVFTISGMCTILTATNDNAAEKQRVIIPGKGITSSPHGKYSQWELIFFDKKTETAFYANIED